MTRIPASGTPNQGQPRRQQHGHGWMMIACCIPMIAIFAALWAADVIPATDLLIPIACTAMMALMMSGMGHDDRHDEH